MIKKIIVVLLATYILIFAGTVSAQDSKINDPSVTPAIINLDLKPGETSKSSFEYINNSEKEQIINLELRAFKPSGGEHGVPLFTDQNGKKITCALTNWVKLEKDTYTVKANDKVKINFEVNTPANAESGKEFVAIFAMLQNNEIKKGGSIINTEIGVVVVGNVQGVTTPEKPITSTESPTSDFIVYAGIAVIILILVLIIGSMLSINKKKKRAEFFAVHKDEDEKPVKTRKVSHPRRTGKTKK